MKRTIFVLIVLAIVAVVLAGGAAFIMQQNRLLEYRRIAAQAEEKMENKQYAEALTLLRKADQEGGNARTTFLLGKAYYERNNPEEALPYFQRIADKYPGSEYMPQALLYQARYQEDYLGKTKQAKDIYLQILEKYPSSDAKDYALYRLGKIVYDEGDIAQAKKFLDAVIKGTDSPAKDKAEFVLGDINMKQLKSPDIGPNDIAYTIERGDSLWKLERKLKVPMDLIQGINNLDPKALTVGEQIKIPDLDISIMINKADRSLTLRNKGAFLAKYHVGINAIDARVPARDYEVIEKSDKGMDYTPENGSTTIKAGDPANPYGSRWLGITREIGIHGTNEPDKVGTYISKGFIAMTNADIEQVYSLVRKGTKVSIKGHNLQESSAAR
jgi:tetratricopeptide (TPR) repeat protein